MYSVPLWLSEVKITNWKASVQIYYSLVANTARDIVPLIFTACELLFMTCEKVAESSIIDIFIDQKY